MIGLLRKYGFFAALAVSIFIYIFHAMYFSVNLIFEDIWDEVFLVMKFHEGSLKFSDFFFYQNEHRIFVHALLSTVSNILTDYNVKALILMGVVVNILSLVLILKIANEDFSVSKYLPAFVIIPFLCLSLKPQQSVFLPDLCRMFLQLFALISFYFIRKRSYFSILAAFLASYSLVPGLLVWFAGLFQIGLSAFFSSDRRKWIIYGSIWIIAGIVCWISYFYILPGKMYGERLTPYIFTHFIATAKFIFYYIGGALFYSPQLGIPAGLFISFLMVLLLRAFLRNEGVMRSPNVFFWTAFLGWSLLSMVLISFGRAQYGLSWAGSERYAYSSLNITVSVIVLTMYAMKNRNSPVFSVSNRILYILCVCGVIMYLIQAPAGAFRNKETKGKLAEVLKNYEKENNASLLKIYPNAERVRLISRFLKEHKYNVFHE